MNWNNILSTNRLRESTREKRITDQRNEFESDFGRILFSPAIRRMHDKTQVFPLTTDDNIHTRLTHSLEVQSVGYSIGLNICNNSEFQQRLSIDKEILLRSIPLILSNVSLCHDIGNPPFGHFGEKIISNYFEDYFQSCKAPKLTENQRKDFINYDGNAQGFRVLTKLQVLQDNYGLNLTIGTLTAYLKYPNLSDEISNIGYYKKIGVFQSEKDHLLKIREISGLDKIRNPLAFLMEAADSICYYVMDIEDSFNKKYYNFEFIKSKFKKYGDQCMEDLFERFDVIFERYLNNVDDENKSINLEVTRIVKFRIFLIQELVNIACTNFLENIDKIEKGEYHNELIFDGEKCLAETLDKFTNEFIFTKREIQSLELTGESVLTGLLDLFIDDIINYNKNKYTKKRAEKLMGLISGSLKVSALIESKETDIFKIDNYYKLRLIVDFISGMTDKFALSLYQKLSGIKIV
ncbi:MAG: dNTP triphosphohydrolase [Bacteroidetes bacterium]|nr:dNTP triphosphohydrolase [Bacteroidota bacterium]MBL7105543.1 dNTP triphosphohydrolase [Bacteroidales bacterium]